jgi:dCMP deaminase
MSMAHSAAKLSKCRLYQVGCLLVSDGRPISMGYNGSVAGFKHCCDSIGIVTDMSVTPEQRAEHHRFSEMFTVHAEQNALVFAAKSGLSTRGCTAYCTMQPCNTCLKLMCQAGVKAVHFSQTYDKVVYDRDVCDMLRAAGMVVTCVVNGQKWGV